MFPELKQVDLDLPVGTLIGRILFPFGKVYIYYDRTPPLMLFS
jgi:hypothetical protein